VGLYKKLHKLGMMGPGSDIADGGA
jgi:hypothetical protein